MRLASSSNLKSTTKPIIRLPHRTKVPNSNAAAASALSGNTSSSSIHQSNIWNTSHGSSYQRPHNNAVDSANVCNVKVIVRCRPFIPKEIEDKNNHRIIEARTDTKEVIIHQKYSKTFNFDAVCGPLTTQKELFDTYVVPTIDEAGYAWHFQCLNERREQPYCIFYIVLDVPHRMLYCLEYQFTPVLMGFNCTIFAYGQTGTGKTHTMEGDETIYLKPLVKEALSATAFDFYQLPASSRDLTQETTAIAIDNASSEINSAAGITPRAIHRIFYELESMKTEYSVRVSYLEIYNEELRDLLSESERLKLRIYDEHGDSGKKGVAVDKLEELPVNNPKDIFNILSQAVRRRRTAATNSNERSSRSHCIFTIVIHMKETNNDGEDVIKIGKLNLVDLAGSENVQRSGNLAVRDRQKEAGMINQSLLTLGRVINALVDNAMYIPYRDSKLTRLLQDSLGGRTKTCIVATISPSSLSVEETFSTLDYAYRAKNIRNKPEVNQRMTKRVMIREMNQEIERLKIELLCAREKNGVYLPFDRYQEMEQELNSKRIEVNELAAAAAPLQKQIKDLEELVSLHKQELNKLKLSNEEQAKELISVHGACNSNERLLSEANDRINEEVYISKMLEKESTLLNQNYEALSQNIAFSIKTAQNLKNVLESYDLSKEQRTNAFTELTKKLTASTAGLSTVENELNSIYTEKSSLLNKMSQEIQSKLSHFPDLIRSELATLNDASSDSTAEFNTLLQNVRLSVLELWQSETDNGKKAVMADLLKASDELKACKETYSNEFNNHMQELKSLLQEEQANNFEFLGKAEAEVSQLNTLLSTVLNNLENTFDLIRKQSKEEVETMRNQLNNSHSFEAFAKEKSEILFKEVKLLIDNYGNAFHQKLSEETSHIGTNLSKMENRLEIEYKHLEDTFVDAFTNQKSLKSSIESESAMSFKVFDSLHSKLIKYTEERAERSQTDQAELDKSYEEAMWQINETFKTFMDSGEAISNEMALKLEDVKKSSIEKNEHLLHTYKKILEKMEQHITGEIKPMHQNEVSQLQNIWDSMKQFLSLHKTQLNAQNELSSAFNKTIDHMKDSEDPSLNAIKIVESIELPVPQLVKPIESYRWEYRNTCHGKGQENRITSFQEGVEHMTGETIHEQLYGEEEALKQRNDNEENELLLCNIQIDHATASKEFSDTNNYSDHKNGTVSAIKEATAPWNGSASQSAVSSATASQDVRKSSEDRTLTLQRESISEAASSIVQGNSTTALAPKKKEKPEESPKYSSVGSEEEIECYSEASSFDSIQQKREAQRCDSLPTLNSILDKTNLKFLNSSKRGSKNSKSALASVSVKATTLKRQNPPTSAHSSLAKKARATLFRES